MPFPPAKPSDWNQPGDERVAKEQVEQLKRREPPQEQEQAKQYVPQPEEPQPVDPFKPIRTIGQEESATFHFIVEDTRPLVQIPLSGPGSYEVTITRRR